MMKEAGFSVEKKGAEYAFDKLKEIKGWKFDADKFLNELNDEGLRAIVSTLEPEEKDLRETANPSPSDMAHGYHLGMYSASPLLTLLDEARKRIGGK